MSASLENTVGEGGEEECHSGRGDDGVAVVSSQVSHGMRCGGEGGAGGGEVATD